MLRHFITTINYEKLIRLQANNAIYNKNKDKVLNTSSSKNIKKKSYNLNNSVIRNH